MPFGTTLTVGDRCIHDNLDLQYGFLCKTNIVTVRDFLFVHDIIGNIDGFYNGDGISWITWKDEHLKSIVMLDDLNRHLKGLEENLKLETIAFLGAMKENGHPAFCKDISKLIAQMYHRVKVERVKATL